MLPVVYPRIGPADRKSSRRKAWLADRSTKLFAGAEGKLNLKNGYVN
jgi:hypothetical protein